MSEHATIEVPPELAGLDLLPVVSMSGGKDSTATALALREAGVEGCRYVFADTGWEAPETYVYLESLAQHLGVHIEHVSAEEFMADKCRRRRGFPARIQRWCTRELKLFPIRDFHEEVEAETGCEVVSVVGVRAAESERRARLPGFEDDETLERWIWRPLIAWSIEDVLAIHHRHGVPVNPLYLRGHERVGCFPCIMSRKEDIRLLAEHAPERIEEIGALEEECTVARLERNAAAPGTHKQAEAHFFQPRVGSTPMKIQDVVEWSRTANGGRQFELFTASPSGGCFRWGLCEPPATADGDEE